MSIFLCTHFLILLNKIDLSRNGAIQGVRWNYLSNDAKKELKEEFYDNFKL
ncbi:hypothetical protein SAMN02745151_02227 [[Clostridium] propionicum DSM 1682]|jgi:hypothetical protein|uniref:Uncharacterized protein n=1 Tax=Anaerotignum propionicum DSM 1682 TaxID=991789 RepID=A0A0X1U6P3_ANAPI|nr:hypothetical protein CPRO_10030 [Anaerotignum propionicum DSM 1682]SHE92138.1 hypothetical protein SAMN02745151_02227 [[Clostridium] propionicum DSM 1682] [Anaerotignum propionicum DSM 1682]